LATLEALSNKQSEHTMAEYSAEILWQRGEQDFPGNRYSQLSPSNASFAGIVMPMRGQIDQLHHEAGAECFIANSVKTELRCEPVYAHE
jgi:hypothetical protein